MYPLSLVWESRQGVQNSNTSDAVGGNYGPPDAQWSWISGKCVLSILYLHSVSMESKSESERERVGLRAVNDTVSIS